MQYAVRSGWSALLVLCRELLVGADEGSRRAAHAALQAKLLSGRSAAAALPALEGALVALETAHGASQSRGLAVMAERFTSAVLTLLSRAATTADANAAGMTPTLRHGIGQCLRSTMDW